MKNDAIFAIDFVVWFVSVAISSIAPAHYLGWSYWISIPLSVLVTSWLLYFPLWFVAYFLIAVTARFVGVDLRQARPGAIELLSKPRSRKLN